MNEYNILGELTKNLINDACKDRINNIYVQKRQSNEPEKIFASYYKTLNNSKLKKKCIYIPKKK